MELGEVISTSYEEGVVYCKVRPVRATTPYENIPVLRPHSGFISVPKQEETVVMDSLKDGTRFITHVLSREEERPESLREGELTIQLDKDTRVRFKENNDGTYDLIFGASGDINVESSGDLVLKTAKDLKMQSEGKVLINGTDFAQHTHDYTTDSGSTNTTTSPN